MFAKFSYLIRTHAVSSPRSQILHRMSSGAQVACGAKAQIRTTKTFLFDCIWSFPYIQEKTKHI